MTAPDKVTLPLQCAFCGRPSRRVRLLIAGVHAAICNDCTEAVHVVLDPTWWQRTESRLSPQGLLEELDRWIVGQGSVKRLLAVAGYRHHRRRQWAWRGYDPGLLPKANILLIGPTGSGKTRLAETFARALALPFVAVDVTALTQAGFVGEDVTSIAERLVEASGNDLEATRFGIVYLDGVDKLAERPSAVGRDVAGASVQQGLLALLEGATLELPRPRWSSGGRRATGALDTSDILFLAGGTFEGLARIVTARSGGTTVGVAADGASAIGDPLSALAPTDLMALGLLPEFVGRFPIIATLAPLDEAALVRILVEPEDALLRQYRTLLAISNVSLEADPEALRAIAREALRRGTGARGLRAVLEEVLLDIMFELPSRRDVRAVRLEGSTFDNLRPALSVVPPVDHRRSSLNR